MSGTGGGYTPRSSGISLPVPVVEIHPNGPLSGQHDTVSVGWMTKPEWEAVKDKSPAIWLFRYKRGYSPKTKPHLGGGYDHDRGYRHPSDTIAGVQRRNYSGGAHNARGGPIPARQSEWAVTRDTHYDALFNPSDWFLAPGGTAQTWPISALATATFNDIGGVGQSGQGGGNTHAAVTMDPHAYRNPAQLLGTQRQYFAFAYAVQDSADPRNHIVGPMSAPIQCDIWPKVQSRYSACGVKADRGRKVRVIQR